MANQLHGEVVTGGVGVRGQDALTPVLFARSNEEATRFCALLEGVDIPALVGDDADVRLRSLGVPVLVPESLHEWSSEVLSAAEAVYSDDDVDDEEDEDEDDFFADDDDIDDDDDDDDEFLDDDFDEE
ncbi:MAG: hypothetical protein ACE5HE_11280 [Phycisphaerae bacterium]